MPSPGRLTARMREEFSKVWIRRACTRRGRRSAHWAPPRNDTAPPGSFTMIRSASKVWMAVGSATGGSARTAGVGGWSAHRFGNSAPAIVLGQVRLAAENQLLRVLFEAAHGAADVVHGAAPFR